MSQNNKIGTKKLLFETNDLSGQFHQRFMSGFLILAPKKFKP